MNNDIETEPKTRHRTSATEPEEVDETLLHCFNRTYDCSKNFTRL